MYTVKCKKNTKKHYEHYTKVQPTLQVIKVFASYHTDYKMDDHYTTTRLTNDHFLQTSGALWEMSNKKAYIKKMHKPITICTNPASFTSCIQKS